MRYHLWAVLGYFALAVIVTYPAALHFTSAVPGDLIADRDQNLWNLWWIRQAFGHLDNPFHTNLLYYPYGVDLYYHTLGLPQGIIALVPQLLWGLPAAYNTVLLVAFTLSGYGAFRLALLYTGKPLASFLGGLVFAFTPYTLDALKGQLEVLSVQWMPLYAEALLRGAKSKVRRGEACLALAGVASPYIGRPPTGRGMPRPYGLWTALAGLVLALAALSSLYYALYLVMFTGAYLLYSVVSGKWSVAGGLRRTVVPLLVALLLLSPYIAGLVADYRDPRLEVAADAGHRLAHSADLLSFFSVPHDHPIWGTGSLRPGVEEPPIHDYLSLGYVAFGLAALGAVVVWRKRDTAFWALLCLAALVLAMGPELQIGRVRTGVPLPFKLVEDLPGFNAIAKPERLVVLGRMCMGVLAAWGAAWLIEKAEGRGQKAEGRRQRAEGRGQKAVGRLLPSALCLLLLLELPIHPRYEQPIAIPGSVSALARQGEGGGLMELPFATGQVGVAGERMLGQTAHGLPIMTGYLSRNYNSPIIDSCSPFWGFISPRDVPVEGREIATPLVASHRLDVLNFYDIRYITLHNRYAGPGSDQLNAKDKAAYMGIVSEVSHAPPLYSGDDASVYGVDPMDMAEAAPVFHVGGGWYAPESAGGAPFRWLKATTDYYFMGTLCVFAPRATRAVLVMEGTSFGRDRQVEVWSAGKSLVSATLPSGGRFAPLRAGPVDWPRGVTEVQIVADGPGLVPQSLNPNANDDRLLSAGFRAVHLETIREK